MCSMLKNGRHSLSLCNDNTCRGDLWKNFKTDLYYYRIELVKKIEINPNCDHSKLEKIEQDPRHVGARICRNPDVSLCLLCKNVLDKNKVRLSPITTLCTHSLCCEYYETSVGKICECLGAFYIGLEIGGDVEGFERGEKFYHYDSLRRCNECKKYILTDKYDKILKDNMDHPFNEL